MPATNQTITVNRLKPDTSLFNHKKYLRPNLSCNQARYVAKSSWCSWDKRETSHLRQPGRHPMKMSILSSSLLFIFSSFLCLKLLQRSMCLSQGESERDSWGPTSCQSKIKCFVTKWWLSISPPTSILGGRWDSLCWNYSIHFSCSSARKQAYPCRDISFYIFSETLALHLIWKSHFSVTSFRMWNWCCLEFIPWGHWDTQTCTLSVQKQFRSPDAFSCLWPT